MDNTEIHVVPNILMIVGLASIGTNWVASRMCQDSMDPTRFPRWKVPLLAWFAVAAVLCCLLIAVVALSYALQGSLEESLKVGSPVMIVKDQEVEEVSVDVCPITRWCCLILKQDTE